MNILALDTSMQACSVAVFSTDAAAADARLSARYEERERGHAEHLMAMIDETLNASGLSIKQMDQFAVCCGPGAFTGVRIGIAAARGLAMTCRKPLIGIGTLQVMAARVRHEQKHQNLDHILGIAIDARRGEIYWQMFDHNGKSLGQPLALCAQAIGAIIKEQETPVVLAGSGAALIAGLETNEIDPLPSTHPNLQPDAARLAELVAGFGADEDLSMHRASPLYLRPADAKIQTGYAIERQ